MSEPGSELHERILNTIRFLSVDAVQKANSGHPGTPMALAGPAFEIFDRHLRFDPTDPEWPLRDRFVLSAGHASMLHYSLLHLYGELPHEEIVNFRQLGSRTAGHPEYGHTPGIEVTTGPLGQGIAHAVGMALAARMTNQQFANGSEDGPGNHFIYGIAGDGDLMEGISSEACSLAGHLGLGNLVFLYDDNQITIDGRIDLSFSEDVQGRFEAQRWHVQKVDGLDLLGLRAALEAARLETGRPSLVILRTTIGYGSPNKADTSAAHGAPLGVEEVELTKNALGWPLEPTFLVPEDVQSALADRKVEKCAEREARDAAYRRWSSQNAEQAAAFEDARARRMPADLVGRLADGMDGKEAATRKHSSEAIQRLAGAVPYLVGGSADLAGSNLTTIKSGGDIGPAAEGSPYAGRNIHFGIREHAMGAVTNGIALDGTFLPFSGTFLVFSDYMRPAIRLAALMGVRSTFVFTHDSIFLGEDGPTHQPVEHLDALRVIPGLKVFRPADGLETALCWAWIAEKAEGPALLSLTRQAVPSLTRASGFEPEDVWKGGYLVRATTGEPDLVFVATGSEVGLACKSAEALAEQGIEARVVSMPSLELFAEQPEAYREGLVPSEGPPVVAVEAGRGWSFASLVGTRGLVYGVDTFGASAHPNDLAGHFGFTPEKLTARVRSHLGR
ncbi:MAG: transketolase [Deltaproteobacteria bacterium]|nr:transketolase [Deltaproteobacteria bacterium]